MIRFATVFGIFLGAASAWAYGTDVASMNESLEFTIERVQGYLKDGQAAKSSAGYDGRDFRAAANVAMTEESDLAHAVNAPAATSPWPSAPRSPSGRAAGGKDKRLLPLLKKHNCTLDAKDEFADCK